MKRLVDVDSPSDSVQPGVNEKCEPPYVFASPGKLVDDDLTLVLKNTKIATIEDIALPLYEFEMRHAVEGHLMGEALLRAQKSECPLIQRWGHIGYSVRSASRGHHYSGRACKLLVALGKRVGLSEFVIVVNDDNGASIRICEWLGAKLESDYLVMHNQRLVKRRRYIYSFDSAEATDATLEKRNEEISLATNAPGNNTNEPRVEPQPNSSIASLGSPIPSEFETPSKSAKTPNVASPGQAKKQLDLTAFFVRAAEKPAKPVVNAKEIKWNEESQPRVTQDYSMGLRSKGIG